MPDSIAEQDSVYLRTIISLCAMFVLCLSECVLDGAPERDGDAYMNMLLGAHAVHKLGVFSRVFLVCLHVNIESGELCRDSLQRMSLWDEIMQYEISIQR